MSLQLRMKYPNFSSQATIRTEKELISCYRSVKSNKHKLNGFVEKKNLALRLDKRLYSNFTKDSISIISNRPQKRCKVSFILYPKIIELFDKYKAKDPLIFYKNNEFYLSIPFVVPNKPLENQDILGLDLGCRRLVTTSDRTDYGRAYRVTEIVTGYGSKPCETFARFERGRRHGQREIFCFLRAENRQIRRCFWFFRKIRHMACFSLHTEYSKNMDICQPYYK